MRLCATPRCSRFLLAVVLLGAVSHCARPDAGGGRRPSGADGGDGSGGADFDGGDGEVGDAIAGDRDPGDSGLGDGAGDGPCGDCDIVTICGDGIVEGAEACDGGSYCASDCSALAGACGDNVLQPGESCDDGVTQSCTQSHDGGDGSCVPWGSCAVGYVLDGGGTCIANSMGLSTPCAHGEGFTLFRFHYDNGSTSARIDVWDATCDYSFAPGSACNADEIYPGFGDVSRTSDGFPIVTTSEYIRVRFSAAGLNFSNAAVYLQGRSYATSSSTAFEVWSPLYGSVFGGPVDNDWVYDWYGVDWTGMLTPYDEPALTAIQLYGSNPGSATLAVQSVELCVW